MLDVVLDDLAEEAGQSSQSADSLAGGRYFESFNPQRFGRRDIRLTALRPDRRAIAVVKAVEVPPVTRTRRSRKSPASSLSRIPSRLTQPLTPDLLVRAAQSDRHRHTVRRAEGAQVAEAIVHAELPILDASSHSELALALAAQIGRPCG